MAISSRSSDWWTLRSAVAWLRSTFPISNATRIAVQIYPELWESARRKLSKSSAVDASFRDYVQVRSAQLAQVQVDELIRAQSRLSGAAANQLLLKASRIATAMILSRVKKEAN